MQARIPTALIGHLLCAGLLAALASGQIRPDNHQLPGTLSPGPSTGNSGGAVQGGGRAPAGFTTVARNGAMGQALTAGLGVGSSAKAAFRMAYKQIAGSFDKPPVLQSAAADGADRQVQGFFRASMNNTPVRGLMIVSATDGKTSALLLFDREDQFSRSLPVLAKQVSDSAPKGQGGPAARPQLVRTQLTDGSGWISLAPGWKITGAYKGTVDTVGPNGEGLSLGGFQQVFPRGNYPKAINGPYLAPWPAWQAYADALNDHALRTGKATMRLLDQTPQPYPGGQGAYMVYEYVQNGKKTRGLVLVDTAPLHDDLGSWFFYCSIALAPAERFAEDLPTLVAMWKSWSVNQAVFQERMDNALKSMRETVKIMQEANAYRQHVFDNTNFGWDETIRGVTMVEDTATHARGEFDTNYAQYLVDEANRQGYQWQVVPTGQLVP